MCKPTNRLFSLHLDSIDPFHFLYVEHRDVLVVGLVFEVRRTVVPTKKHHQHLIYDAALLLALLGVFALYAGDRHPFLLGDVERVVVLEEGGVVSTEDDRLRAVRHHRMEGATVGQGVLSAGSLKLEVDLGERVVELTSTVAFVMKGVPPKM